VPISISVFGGLIFLIVAAWRKDREKRLSNPGRESAAVQNISFAREWDPLADLLEDAARGAGDGCNIGSRSKTRKRQR
jgi:hypothetical protein